MRDDEKKLLEQEEKELAEMAKEEEKWKQQRIKDGNLFTGYDKVSTKSKKELLLKMWHNTKDHDSKLIIDDLLRDVERTKLGLTLNYHYVDEKLEKSDTVFVEQKGLSLNPKEKDPNHLIIEGDNMHTLTALKNTKQEVDVIYIDPMYNTGNEFAYNDKIVSNEDQQKHSKWLSFMKQRLELAKDIMSDDGVIFVSIDDHEQAYLKVLMDEIFGEQNLITSFIWERTSHSNKNSGGKKVFRNVDYVHTYSKNLERVKYFTEGIKTEFEDAPLKNNSNPLNTLTFPKGSVFHKTSKKWNVKDESITFKCRWSQKKINEEIKKGTTFIIKGEKIESIRAVYSSGKVGYKIPNQLLNTSKLFVEKLKKPTTENGTIELKRILGEGSFQYPKPSKLIKYLINLNLNKNATVLDFFAGSGTTGQAVMELNQEDGGNRRFILCTNNERTGVDTIKHPEKGIAQAICRERIYRVINGEGSKGEKIAWRYSDDVKSLKNNTVTYLKTELVNKRRQLEEEKGTHLNSGLFYKSEQVNLYRREFDTDSTEVATDFKKRKTIRKHSMDR